MHSVPAHLFQCLDRDLSREALHTLTAREAGQLADLLEHWRQLADLHAGRPASVVSRETPSIDALLDACAALAQAVQDVVDQSLESAAEADPETLAAVQVDIDRIEAWESAYAAFGSGASPAGAGA